MVRDASNDNHCSQMRVLALIQSNIERTHSASLNELHRIKALNEIHGENASDYMLKVMVSVQWQEVMRGS